jgi:hypothetical protein
LHRKFEKFEEGRSLDDFQVFRHFGFGRGQVMKHKMQEVKREQLLDAMIRNEFECTRKWDRFHQPKLVDDGSDDGPKGKKTEMF